MKRLSLVVIVFMLLCTLIALNHFRPASAGAAQTATPGPSLTPGTAPNPASTVTASQVYFHSSGIMSIPQPDNWPLADQGGEELTLPNVGSKLTRAGITFINTDALSVVHAFAENAPGRSSTGTIGMDTRFDQEFWNEAWANFTGGWKETARRDDGRRFVVDFDLSLDGAVYRGRQVSRVENNWLIVLRLVGPKENPRLIEDLDRAVWPGITVYPDAANTPPEWVSIIDQHAGYMLRVPDDWKAGEAVPGNSLKIRGVSNRVPVTIRAKAEPGKMARTDQAAQFWVRALHKDAKIISTAKEPRIAGNGISVAYSAKDESGGISSGLAVLLNGPNYTLFSADILVGKENLNLLTDKDLDTVFKQLHNALIVFPAKQAVYGGETVLLPSRTPLPTGTATQTPMPTPTLDPGAFDMSMAHTYTSPDGVLSLSLPRGWQTSQPSGDLPVWIFYLGDSPDEESPSFQIVLGSLDQLGLNEDEIVSGTAQGILEAIKKEASASDPGTYGKVQSANIGSVHGYRLQGHIPQQGQSPALDFELRLAQLPNNQWIYISAVATEENWTRLQRVFNLIMDSMKVNVEKLPQSAPTATPQSL